jgi:hypothetical protein
VSLLRRLLPPATLVALPLLLYAPLLFGGKVLYWGVYLLQFYPWRRLAVEQIWAGHWPLWNPYLGAGAPLAANLQTAAFYPPNILFLVMTVEHAFGWALALHVALAGTSAYWLGRTLGLSRFGALISGLAYGLGGYVVARWLFPSMVYAAAWLPLILALAERLISNIQSRISNKAHSGYWILDIALLALAIALQLLAGHAQTSFYSLLILAAFSLYRIFQLAPRTPDPIADRTRRLRFCVLGFVRSALPIALATLWALALAVVQLLPTAELVAHSQRAGTLTDLQFAYELSFWPWRLITLLAPDFFGHPARSEYWAYGTYWEEAVYVGILPLILAGLAAVAWWRKRGRAQEGTLHLVPFLLALGLLSILLALGNHTPLYPLLFRYVPGFGLFQAPARLMIGYALAAALLAGIGADALPLTPRVFGALRLSLIAGLGIALAGGAARLALPAVRPSFGQSALRLGISLALGAGLLLLRSGYRRRGRLSGWRWQALVAALVATDLLAFGWGLAPGTDPVVYRRLVDTAEVLQEQPPGRLLVAPDYREAIYDRYVSLQAFGPDDTAYLHGLRQSLLPNLPAIHHLPAVGNYDPLTVGAYQDLYDLLASTPLQEAQPLLDLLGVRYLLSGDELALPQIYEATAPEDTAAPKIYLNETALPSAYVVHQARIVEDGGERLTALLDPEFDPRVEVLLSRSPPVNINPDLPRADESPPDVLRRGPDQLIIDVAMSRPGYLVLTETHYPGWRATVDGESAEILVANHALRAVQLAAGEHVVEFEYAPLSFRWGAWITLGAILLLAGLVAAARLRTRGSRPDAGRGKA